jgi:hypothetical protein
MTTMTRTYDGPAAIDGQRGKLRQLVTGAAGFDTAMGIFCLAASGRIGGWLSLSTADVRITAGVFLLAALTGAVTAIRGSRDVRAIMAANLVFAAWCLAMLGGGPNALGVVLLIGSALSAVGTAALEQRTSRQR